MARQRRQLRLHHTPRAIVFAVRVRKRTSPCAAPPTLAPFSRSPVRAERYIRIRRISAHARDHSHWCVRGVCVGWREGCGGRATSAAERRHVPSGHHGRPVGLCTRSGRRRRVGAGRLAQRTRQRWTRVAGHPNAPHGRHRNRALVEVVVDLSYRAWRLPPFGVHRLQPPAPREVRLVLMLHRSPSAHDHLDGSSRAYYAARWGLR
eukprot:6436277-Prymnesium_polylepis.4